MVWQLMNGVATKQHPSLQDAAECVWAAPFNAQCHSAEAPRRSSMHSVTLSRCPSAAVAQSKHEKSCPSAQEKEKEKKRSLIGADGGSPSVWVEDSRVIELTGEAASPSREMRSC